MSKTKIRLLQIAVLLVVGTTLIAVNSVVYVPAFTAFSEDLLGWGNSTVHSTSPPSPEAYGVTPTNIIIYYVLGLVGFTLLLLGVVLLFLLIVTKLSFGKFQKQR
jgi:hypothetical protein